MLTIDLSALARNYDTLKAQVAPTCTVAGVVKANGYGTGAIEAAMALYKRGCRTFFVAHETEGVTLRKVMPHDIEIAIFNGLGTGSIEGFKTHKLIPCLSSQKDVILWHETSLPAILNFDTGMSRLGFSNTDTETILADPSPLSDLKLRAIMSHLVSSEEPANSLNDIQLERFQKIVSLFPDTPKSLANSSGIYLGEPYHFDMVRPGYALYGGNPTPTLKNPMNHVVTLAPEILQIKQVQAGATAGYNSTYTFPRDTHIAVLNIGYADGLLRLASNRASFNFQGVPCPIRGRVSMDLTIVELPDTLPTIPKEGDRLELLGASQSVDTLADIIGTNGYEILTSLGTRYKREYISN
ncbi:MAG: alanine racemase [Alphaproteobacteria bacterium]|nr:alanine racemase [Alphaproteobacteria bacterium]